MTKIEQATEEEWREIGKDAKELNERLTALIGKISRFLPGRETDKLIKCSHIFDIWRSNAESEMMKRGGPEDKGVFYE